MPRFSSLDGTIRVIAHRGARTLETPELSAPPGNTLAAFREAANRQASLEVDVMATKDGVVVCTHDFKLSKKSEFSNPKGGKSIHGAIYGDIQKAKFNTDVHEREIQAITGNRDYKIAPEHRQETIPRLDNLVERFPGSYMYLDLKTHHVQRWRNNHLEKRVIELIREKNLYDRVTVMSNSPFTVRKLRQLDPKVKIGYSISNTFHRFKPLAKLMLQLGKRYQLDSVHVPFKKATEDLVKLAHKNNIKLITWASKESREEEAQGFAKLIQMGVDGITTNAVDLLQAFLAKANIAQHVFKKAA